MRPRIVTPAKAVASGRPGAGSKTAHYFAKIPAFAGMTQGH
jgi:hypothetical protein